MIRELYSFLNKPDLYKPGAPFWNDEHISKGLLEAHLNAGWDAASRKHSFIDRSALWISKLAPPAVFPSLLDLGCGPGLYTERFHDLGYSVTGVDFSERSVNHAKTSAADKGFRIDYVCGNYLELDFEDCFDVVTIIYCDYGALSDIDRRTLCAKAFIALRDRGKLIVDCFTPVHFEREVEETSFEFCEAGGFWRKDCYLVLNASLRYPEAVTLLRRHVILTDNSVDCYNFYDCCFSKESLEAEFLCAGFRRGEFFSDVAGRAYSKKSETMCGVFTK